MTPQARFAFEYADEALYLVADPVAAAYLEGLNPRARSLADLYEPSRPRRETYEAMVEETLTLVRAGRRVCTAFYGHPGIFVYPGQETVPASDSRGHRTVRLLPGISSLDCLWSDLGIDPAAAGCQIYHATDLVPQARRPDTAATLILLQISVIGQPAHLGAARLVAPAAARRLPAGVLPRRSRGDRVPRLRRIRSLSRIIVGAPLAGLAEVELRSCHDARRAACHRRSGGSGTWPGG